MISTHHLIISFPTLMDYVFGKREESDGNLGGVVAGRILPPSPP